MLIFGMSFDFYRGGEMYRRWDCVYPEEAEYTSAELDAVYLKMFWANSLSSSCNKLLKRNILWDNQIRYNENMMLMEDLLFVVQALSHSKTVYLLPQVIYRYFHSDEQSGENDNAVVRVSKIPNLEEYLRPINESLESHPETMAAIYYMLLEQRLRYQKPREIKASARNYCNSPYSKGVLYQFCPSSSKKTVDQLKQKQYLSVYFHHRFRRKAVSILRKTPLYTALKKLKEKQEALHG